jgi:hypothetical protein
MKTLKITPEWVLEKLPQTTLVDDKGYVTLSSDSLTDSHWIDLALKTLKINYESLTVGYDPDPKEQYFEVQWHFKINDIKDDCPTFYENWKFRNDAQASTLKVPEQLNNKL